MLKKILKRQGAIQGSQEWLNQRRKLITATDMPAIIGLNPFCSIDQLLQKKRTSDVLKSDATEWGNFFEDIAAVCYQKKKNPSVELIQPNLIYHSKEDFLAASPDRIIKDGNNLSLLEIKCPFKRNLSDKPAKMYLAQIQHQLEVCDLDIGYLWECSFGVFVSAEEYNNDCRFPIKGHQMGTYWYLKSTRLTEVKRDLDWYQQKVYPELKRFNRRLNCRKRKRTITVENTINESYQDYWQPYQLNNYLRQDALLDWLNLYGEKYGYQKDPKNEFMSMLNTQKAFLKLKVREKLGLEPQVCGDVKSTLEAIKMRVPLIENAVLVDNNKKLLVKVPFILFDKKEKCYRVIEVKFKKLTLLKESKHLSLVRSQLSVQINAYFAAKILQNLQRQKILEPIVYGSNLLGYVNLEKLELEYKTKLEDALLWLQDIITNGNSKRPGDDTYMSPNMCNHKDYPWHQTKVKIAQILGDITQVWQCRPKNRAEAIDDGIISINDPNCTAENIGFGNFRSNAKYAPTVDAILKQCRSVHQRIPLDWSGLIDHQTRDYYIDLEFVGKLLITKEHPSMIYLIGFGHMDQTNKWNFTSFVAETLT